MTWPTLFVPQDLKWLEKMDSRQSVYWHQGLFLQPQHFQHLEQNQRVSREPFVRMINPYPWGIEHLSIADSAIGNRVFEVRRLKALLPDQTYLEYPGNTIIASRSFDKLWDDPDQPLMVYLAIRRLTSAAPNVTVIDALPQASGVQTRYASLSNPKSERDLYGDGSEALVPTIVHVAKIVFENELKSLEDHEVMAIYQLVRDGEQIRTVTHFSPPLVAVDASDYLVHLVRDIRDDMLSRLRQLEEYKSPRGVNAEDLDANFLIMMQAVQVLNRHVPALTHFIEARGLHPWIVYGQLRQCVGELSTFSHRIDVFGRTSSDDDGLPAYDHERLGVCFAAARDLTARLLSEIAVGPEFHVTLQLENNYFTGDIPQEYFAGRNRFYLILQSEEARDIPAQDLLASSRLAAPSSMSDLIDYALPGIELFELPGPPQGLPRRGDSRYFRIEQVSEEWGLVQEQGAVSFYWADAPDSIRVIVVVTKG